jgi:hypothetical protein
MTAPELFTTWMLLLIGCAVIAGVVVLCADVISYYRRLRRNANDDHNL